MPFGNHRGPEGYGPRTGRGLGYCNGYNMPGYMNNADRRGMGRGNWSRGGGRGMGRGYGQGYGRGYGRGNWNNWGGAQFVAPTPWTAEEEKAFLEDNLKYREEEIVALKKRLEKLEQPAKDTE